MILLIDNYDSFTYNLYQTIAVMDVSIKVVRNDKISLAKIEALKPSGIIFSPGPGRPETAGICVEAVKAFSGKIPMLGVCLGHQAIAQAFGGNVIHAPSIVHGKNTHIFHHRRHLFHNLSLPLAAGRYHSLIVERASLPPVFNITSENAESIIMSIQHKTHPTFGIQFHPESILTPEGDRLLKNFVDLTKEDTC